MKNVIPAMKLFLMIGSWFTVLALFDSLPFSAAGSLVLFLVTIGFGQFSREYWRTTDSEIYTRVVFPIYAPIISMGAIYLMSKNGVPVPAVYQLGLVLGTIALNMLSNQAWLEFIGLVGSKLSKDMLLMNNPWSSERNRYLLGRVIFHLLLGLSLVELAFVNFRIS